jgi:hypothetical protein
VVNIITNSLIFRLGKLLIDRLKLSLWLASFEAKAQAIAEHTKLLRNLCHFGTQILGQIIYHILNVSLNRLPQFGGLEGVAELIEVG